MPVTIDCQEIQLMKSLKKWVLILGLAGPAVTNLSCMSATWQNLRDAAIGGVSAFVEDATFDLLSANLDLGTMLGG